MTEPRVRSLVHPATLVALLAVVLAVVLAGCGDHRQSASGPGSATSTPTGTPTPTTSTSTTQPNATGIPDDFPLAHGLAAGGDTTVSAPKRGVPGIRLQQVCWRDAWPGPAVDRLVVEQLGPELGVTRELAVYPDAATASAVAEQVRVDAAHCHRLPATAGEAAMDVTLHGDADAGVPHVVASFSETLTGGQPGGSVLVFTRVGRAVLAVVDSGEWTRDSAAAGVRQVERADRVLVARMCVFTHAGC
ncbi:MAG: hypothetical protein WB797_01895 [Nocardioides sp.]